MIFENYLTLKKIFQFLLTGILKFRKIGHRDVFSATDSFVDSPKASTVKSFESYTQCKLCTCEDEEVTNFNSGIIISQLGVSQLSS